MEQTRSQNKGWDIIIRPSRSLFDFGLKEVWQYRDLLLLLVRREYVTIYKQTILGPLWYLIQPAIYTVFLVFVFGQIAQVSTEDVPQPLFFLAGITLWNYISECAKKTSVAFIANANVFGKVYFPRLILPLSIVLANLIKLGMQYALFIGVFVYFIAMGYDGIDPSLAILITPLLFLLLTLIGFGMGIILSSLSAKYRDLRFAVEFGINLLMYTTTVAFPLSQINPGLGRTVLELNPVTPLIEAFRNAYFGASSGAIDWLHIAYSGGAALALIFVGMLIFNRIEKTFVDTV